MPSLLSVKGLNTFDSELTLADGSLKIANNVVVDRQNTARPRRGFKDYGASFSIDSERAKQLLTYKSRLLRHYGSVLQFDNGSGVFTSFNGTYSELETGLRIKYQEANSNLYFTTTDGIKKISAKSASTFSSAAGYIKTAGVPKSLDTAIKLVYDIAGYLPPSSKSAYRVVWGYTDANNNLLLGGVSSRVIATNISETIDVPEKATVTTTGAVVANLYGDYFLLTSGDGTEYFVWYSDGTTPQPVTSQVINRTPIEVDLTGATTDVDVAAYTGAAIGQNPAFSVEVSTTVVTITNEVGGDSTDISDGASPTGFTFQVIEQGRVINGLNANAELTFTIPEDARSVDYFYQIYRTASSTVSTGVALEDLDPGDEMNLVYESGLTPSEVTAGEVVFIDDISETFRASGTPLYTNPQSGDGILSSNERPPIAKDVALFRNSMFYANTKTLHRKTINLLSVGDFTSGVSKFVVGNSTGVRKYTFVGETNVQDIETVADVANSLNGKYFILSSANDETDYYVWFTSANDDVLDPEITGKIGVKVKFTENDTADNIASALVISLNETLDFTASAVTNVVTITWAKNGYVTGNAADVDTGFTFNAPSTMGEGEEADTAEGGNVLISSLISIGQSIDETARSLIRIINKDTNGIVTAQYLSGPDDLPGIILLESKTIADLEFYLMVEDSNITDMFNPELSASVAVSSVSIANPTVINTSTSHGLSTGNSVFLYDFNTTATVNGVHDVTVLSPTTFSIPVNVQSVIDGTGFVVLADVVSDNEESPNRIYYSKPSQPEAVPIVNYIDIGPRDKEIRRILALRDNLYVLKDDGVYIVTGSSIPFQTRLIDSSSIIIAPDSAAILNNQIYFLSTQGVASASDAGIEIVSRPIENLILDVTRFGYNFKTASFGVGYENDRAYMLWVPQDLEDEVAMQCFRYSTYNNYWTRWTKTNVCGVVNPADDKLYLGAGDRNYIEQERKDGERTDFCDREFVLSIPSNAISEDTIELSSTENAAKGDVLVQVQYVTISQYNRLLRKLDTDYGLNDADYISTLEMVEGDNMTNKLQALAAKLNVDDSQGGYSTSGSTDPEVMQDDFNSIIDRLNQPTSDSQLIYEEIEGFNTFETIVISVTKPQNLVTVAYQMPFIQGNLTLYKGYQSTVSWAPQHFGDAANFKQVREGSILFDANNFYSAEIYFSTDRSKAFEGIEFKGKGVGSWGVFDWGDTTWGGEGTDEGIRTLVPRDKQRCRYITVRFDHFNAREEFSLLGISLEPRPYSSRAYRSGANRV